MISGIKNENPGALAGASGAELHTIGIVSEDYWKRAEAATSLCMAIGNCDPLAFVISHNLHRRHLTESQRASVAARLANMEQGRPADKGANLHLFPDEAERPAPVTVAQAAEMLNVSERSVKSARKVQEQGTPELVKAVDSGIASVSAAAAIAAAQMQCPFQDRGAT